MIDLRRIFWLGTADEDAASSRRQPRWADAALSGTARAWLRQLPSGQRPLRLCRRFPGLANRLAWCWHDMLLTEECFDEWLCESRAGGQGLPRAVLAELRRLRAHRARQLSGAPAARAWDWLRDRLKSR